MHTGSASSHTFHLQETLHSYTWQSFLVNGITPHSRVHVLLQSADHVPCTHKHIGDKVHVCITRVGACNELRLPHAALNTG